MKNERYKRLTVYIDHDQAQLLEHVSKLSGINASALIRQILRNAENDLTNTINEMNKSPLFKGRTNG